MELYYRLIISISIGMMLLASLYFFAFLNYKKTRKMLNENCKGEELVKATSLSRTINFAIIIVSLVIFVYALVFNYSMITSLITAIYCLISIVWTILERKSLDYIHDKAVKISIIDSLIEQAKANHTEEDSLVSPIC